MIRVTFTDETAETCTGGDWRKISLLGITPEQSSGFLGKPAYLSEGSALWIDFTANICDSEDAFVGEITDQGFIGHARTGGLTGSTDQGPVFGTRVHLARAFDNSIVPAAP